MRVCLLIISLLFWPAMVQAGPDVAICGPQYNALARTLPPFEDLVRKAGLEEHLPLLRAKGKAVIDGQEFLSIRKSMGKGYLLAVDGMGKEKQFRYASEFFSSPMGLLRWPDGYRDVGVYYKANKHTEEFMEKITANGKPIVFLVPPEALQHDSFTKSELLWLLKNPERMRNVTFVFGAYDLIPAEMAERFGKTRSWDEVRKHLEGLGDK